MASFLDDSTLSDFLLAISCPLCELVARKFENFDEQPDQIADAIVLITWSVLERKSDKDGRLSQRLDQLRDGHEFISLEFA